MANSTIAKVISILLVLSLIAPITAFSLPNAAEKGKNLAQHNRYIVEYESKLENGEISIEVASKITDFKTGKTIMNRKKFTDTSLLPKIEGRRARDLKKVSGVAYSPHTGMTPTGVKSYLYLEAESKDKRVLTIYEYDIKKETLKKIVDVKKEKLVGYARAYPTLGVYIIRRNGEDEVYSIASNKLLYKGGLNKFYGYGLVTKPTTPPVFREKINYFDYILTDWSSGSGAKYYKISYGGKRTKLTVDPSYVNSYHDYDIPVDSKAKINVKSEFIRHNNWDFTVTWTNGKISKTLLKDIRLKHMTASVSPTGKYLILYATKKENDTLSHMIYLYDLKNQKWIKKFNSPYGFEIYKIIWFSDNLLLLNFETSNPGRYSPLFYTIDNDLFLKSNRIFISYSFDDEYFYDDFNYDGLLSLNRPNSLVVEDQYIVYSKQGTFYFNGKSYIPLDDITNFFNIEVEEREKEFVLRKDETEVIVSKAELLKVKDQKLLRLGEWREKLGLSFKIQ